MVAPAKLKDMIENLPCEEFILLDLRVFPQFAESRIKGALNLCIPTTLLKRPSFNVQKLQDTFTNDIEKARFSQWANSKYIVVYDAHSGDRKEATTAVNTLKKFSNEGWKGTSYILNGGFAEFRKSYPDLIDNRSAQEMQSSKINLTMGTPTHRGAAVAGGCIMPKTQNAANPFFGNIRQNQDLRGGVGLVDMKVPEELAGDKFEILPKWLQRILAREDEGKKASQMFLRIEEEEQARMKKALSLSTCYGPDAEEGDYQIAGLEKGGKNRYNNIWPFEHARVRLKGRPEGSCDYINASHIKASRSKKRYIAAQGPLPDTFAVSSAPISVLVSAHIKAGFLECHLPGGCPCYRDVNR
jgi:protein-tyrosine phosphatase